jgi:hypothetical protein
MYYFKKNKIHNYCARMMTMMMMMMMMMMILLFTNSFQNGSGTHPASYPMGTRGSFPGGKEARA